MIKIHNLFFHKHQFVPVDRTLELYFCGCSHNCPGCQNPELQTIDFKTCRSLTPVEIVRELMDYLDVTKEVHILGGEPLEQPVEGMCELLDLMKEVGFSRILLFTGRNLDESLVRKDVPVFKHVDYVKIGEYQEHNLNTEKKPDPVTGIVLSSRNQKFVEVK